MAAGVELGQKALPSGKYSLKDSQLSSRCLVQAISKRIEYNRAKSAHLFKKKSRERFSSSNSIR